MPTTRSQVTEKVTSRVYEEPPASPSVSASVHIPTAPTVTTTAGSSRPIAAYVPTTLTSHELDPPPRTTAMAGVGSRAPSVHSQHSTASAVARIRQAEFEAEEQLAEIRKQELQLQATLIKKRLAMDVATIREETDRESIGAEEPGESTRRVTDWLQHTHLRGEQEDRNNLPIAAGHIDSSSPRLAHRQRDARNENTRDATHRTRSPTPMRSRDRGIEKLADVLEKMTRNRIPPRQTMDLPLFSGAIGEWLPFKAAMEESTNLYNFSAAENLARLRSCLRGKARDAVAALLYTASDIGIIMRTLEQCFGRPEIIIDNALEDIKKLPRLGSTASELNNFAVKLQNIVTIISCIDDRGYLQNPMLARQVTEKLSPHIKSRWCDYAEQHGDRRIPQIITLSQFLMKEADRAVRYAYSTSVSDQIFNKNTTAVQLRRHNDRNRGVTVYATTESNGIKTKRNCICCGANHETVKCKKLTDMTIQERWDWAKESRVCFLCLNSKHRRYMCKAKRCGIGECRMTHHAMLHADAPGTKESKETEDSAITAAAQVGNAKVLLKVCPITLKGSEGQEVNAYAMMDEGSTITLISKELAETIGAHGPNRALHIHGATSSQKETESKAVEINIRGHNQKEYHPIKARTVSNLTLGCQTIDKEVLKSRHLRQLKETDVCYADARPTILIGADNWHLIVTRKLLTGGKNQPAASLTRLGWVVHGTTPRTNLIRDETQVLHVRTAQQMVEKELNDLVKKHFDIDALGVTLKRKPVPAEERAVTTFENTTARVNGRYSTGLPWKTDNVVLPPSYDMAHKRLKSIERQMDKSIAFRDSYTQQINQLLEKGYASPCMEECEEKPRLWYLPHFAVTNPNKPGKIRLVFDAAAKSNGVSLNDMLLDGPDLLQSLNGVLYRFREKPVAVTADIKEMFLQVKIRPEDQTAQHFLWRGDERTNPPSKYKMTSMIFGARSSPFIAHSVRNKNATINRDTHPIAYREITENHYMDDWVTSFATIEEAVQAIEEVVTVHREAGFELAGWNANRNILLKHIPEIDKARDPKELGTRAHLNGKTLGLIWKPETDELSFNTVMPRVSPEVKDGKRDPTKREALSAVMSIFDPLGLLAPYTITAKIMLQELWKKNVGWDDSLPPEEARTFQEWLEDLEYISRLKIPRCYCAIIETQRRLHVFVDASEQAYAAAAYWHIKHENGEISVVLVSGKAKVAPMRAQTIPRMELQAALIGARLATDINASHKNDVANVTLWTDSRTVLHWIRHDSARYTPYVAHRLSEIAELVDAKQWRWIPTNQNVADDATRIGKTKMSDGDRWFQGPAFLYEPEEQWPTEQMDEPPEAIERVLYVENKLSLINFERFSSYDRIRRAIAYVLLFSDRCKRRATKLNAEHINKAEIILIREAQRESYPVEIDRIKKGMPVEKNSSLRKLDPMQNEQGIICLNSRLNGATVPENMKNPPILNGKHYLTRLIIMKEHTNNGHVGKEHVVNNLRQCYWITQIRAAVKSVLAKCTICAIKKTQPVIPIKGNLPTDRLSAFTRPFTKCGIDAFGPMWVQIGRRREKRWGLLFTCLVTRAIHVELIAGLSTDSAIMAMRRMAARRGWPSIFYSDNGTNFHGSEVELRSAMREWLPELENYTINRKIFWKYNDPGAANQGGVWERMIRSVKTSLSVVLSERAPKEEVLATLLAEVEHTVNSRPLTHVSVNPEDSEALTPNHFLLGTSIGMPLIGTCDTADRKAWRAAQALANMFWARWVKEYLPTLGPRDDTRKRVKNVNVGDVVIIVDGQLPRNVWPRGQVERIHPGSDGVVRSVDVRTRGGIFRRPVRRLIVLPTECIGSEGLRRGEDVTDNEPKN